MLPLAVIGPTEWFLIVCVLLALFGLPLVLVVFLLGSWMRRTGRASALKTFVCALSCGVVALLAFVGAIVCVTAIAKHEHRQPGYSDEYPLPALLMIALGLVTLATAFGSAFFAVWTIWRLVEAPPAQPLRTTPVS